MKSYYIGTLYKQILGFILVFCNSYMIVLTIEQSIIKPKVSYY